MKRLAIIAAVLFACASAFAQTDERALLRRADFSKRQITETPPAGANAAEKAMWGVRRQMTGHDMYEPANYMFFRPAVREIGFFPAIFATADRILRDTKLGTAYAVPDMEDGKIHEGPEAYSLKRTATSLRPGELEGNATLQDSRFCDSSNAGPKAQSPAKNSATRWVSQDFDFVQYLLDNDLKQDARQLLFSDTFHPSDTLTYLRGWTLFQLKELEAANGYLQAVQPASTFYDKSFFYSNVVYAKLGDYRSPAGRLEAYDGPYAELKGMQLAGLALLRDDPEAFKSAAGAFRYDDFKLESAERDMMDIYERRYNTAQKSPWLAAAASALVPGLGKIYAGQIGEGISSFLVTGVMGGITAEHWIKDGPKDWKTIVPAVLTGILYIGSIYGSYMSVSIYNNTLYDAQETVVMYNIHIPLRSVFQ